MKTATPHFADAFTPFAPAAPQTGTTLAGLLRSAVSRAERMVCGTDPEAARNAYLAESVDQADLERRAEDWDRAQRAYRALPPAL
ncbi:hypothetical protein [Pseudorhodoferax sp.]|uniref:hypothetical protein n=1 Tax=Pseudorhodoferax sp. TaxID=1993553 RepID=UPI002DD62200|nr:hypothetical protein [Pseudorhodoferax sp.]